MTQTSSNNSGTDQVLVEETSNNVRTFILNRPKQLNALTFQMISRLLQLFYATEGNSNVKMIILKRNGRAFCAGGDVAHSAHNVRQGNWKLSAEFVREQFTLSYVMATYSKPQICAMPETALGTFPDVGASYFYSRLPGFFGEYAGLTGARLDGAEMLDVGLATHFVPSEKLPFLEQALAKVNTSDANVISVIISCFSNIPKLKAESPCHKMKIIDSCFSRRTIEEIISSLENEALNNKDNWISSTIQSLKKASPISLKISLRSIREGRLQDVGSCLIREYRMVCHVIRGEYSKDILEGCRAILIDKDRNPKWDPSRLELIRDEDVDSYFSKIDNEDWEDLKLPPRSKLPPYAIAKL